MKGLDLVVVVVVLVLLAIPAGMADGRSTSPAQAAPHGRPVATTASAAREVRAEGTPAPSPPAHITAPRALGGLERPRPIAFPPTAQPVAPPKNGYRPQANVVNPYAHYYKEPAPMGLGDFGVSSSGAGYTYSTSRFLGTMQIRSWTAASAVSIQLNVVEVLTHGGTTTAFWIQDVPFYDTSTRTIDFEDNIWNMSSSSGYLPSSSLRGNGTTYSSPSFYADDAGYSYNGSMVQLTLPVNVSAEVVASTISGITHVGFRYNDGYGWQTYDNVSFPWSTGWTSQGFVVDGTQLNGLGLYDDAEWILGGPGGGSSTTNQKSNLTFLLDFWNGHNYQAVPNAYNFGSDTAETISNVVETLPSGASLGAPTIVVTPGSATLRRIYNQSGMGNLNVTPLTPNGTLWVRGNATPFVGSDINLTLVPGSYRLIEKNGSRVVSATTVALTGGRYLGIYMPAVHASPAQAPAGAVVNFTGRGFAPGGTATLAWPASGSSLCTATISSSGWFNCTVTMPRVAATLYPITATDGSTAASSATMYFRLTTDLRIVGSASVTTTDVGLPVSFNASASGGYGPYASYEWGFGDGVNVSSATAPAVHSYSVGGSYSVIVQVTDSVGSVANATIPLQINALPHVAAPSASASSADVGQTVTFTARASLGTPPYGAYRWTGLAAGCATTNTSTVSCTFVQAGTFFPQASVTDSLGVSSDPSVSLTYTVLLGPTVSVPTASPPSVDLGQSASFHASATPGAGGLVYAWTGLPPGCAGTTATVRCNPVQAGSFRVAAGVTDANGLTVNGAAALPFSVYPPPTLPTAPTLSHPAADVQEAVTFSAIASSGSGGFTYAWTGLPIGCSSVDGPNVTCTPAVPGNYEVHLSATDSNLVSADLAFGFEVMAQLQVAGPVADVSTTDLGRTVHLNATAIGGAAGTRYVWSGLPAGCTPAGHTVACTPSTTGSWLVDVNVSDLNGALASGLPLRLVVNEPPRVTAITASPPGLIPGMALTMAAEVSGGSPGYTYAWKGLPPGCAPVNAKALTCDPSAAGTFVVSLALTDAVGDGANATVPVTIAPAFLGLPATEGYALVGAIVGIAVIAAVALLLFRRARARRGATPLAPADPRPAGRGRAGRPSDERSP